ncbi:MAG: hypothetical protein ONB05_03985 [candidate division KSB1 bacterium]|nr:hypothetical protein [candidate division KSB1 bacterium]
MSHAWRKNWIFHSRSGEGPHLFPDIFGRHNQAENEADSRRYEHDALARRLSIAPQLQTADLPGTLPKTCHAGLVDME